MLLMECSFPFMHSHDRRNSDHEVKSETGSTDNAAAMRSTVSKLGL